MPSEFERQPKQNKKWHRQYRPNWRTGDQLAIILENLAVGHIKVSLCCCPVVVHASHARSVALVSCIDAHVRRPLARVILSSRFRKLRISAFVPWRSGIGIPVSVMRIELSLPKQ